MSDEEYKFVRECAALENISVADFFLRLALRQRRFDTVSDEELLIISDEVMNERAEVYEALAK